MIYTGKLHEYLELKQVDCKHSFTEKKVEQSPLTFIWFLANENSVQIDGSRYHFKKNQIVCLTEFHNVKTSEICDAKIVRFNKPFYCVISNDSEVGCKGVLFFGATQLPFFTISKTDLETFQLLWKMMELEMNSQDDLQQEMLQILLKRYIILCTRAYKSQHKYLEVSPKKIDLIRAYNFLVEQHFRTKHKVIEYASLLHKSPKTLSNLFSKISDKTPLQFIQDRKLLEAKRLLAYSDKSIKEIAFEIGFEDQQSFGRFFKNNESVSPSAFRNSH